MPIIDGKVVRARFTSLKLGEISSVDNPAQPGATATVIKRLEDRDEMVAELAKFVCEGDGAHSFSEVLTGNKFSEQIWPYTDALTQSIRSIVGDTSLTGADREGKVSASVAEYLSAVRSISPETEKQLAELIMKRDVHMPKTVAELEAEVSTLKADNATLTADLAKAKDDKACADQKAKDAEDGWMKAKKDLADATDEVIKVDGKDVKKSELGDVAFSVVKSLEGRAQTAEFEKRADAEFRHVVGTTAEKADVLKALAVLPEATRKAAEAIITSAEKMVASTFERMGSMYAPTVTNKAAQGTFDEKVAEIQKRDGGSKADAMSKARRAHPEEFAAAYGDAPAAN